MGPDGPQKQNLQPHISHLGNSSLSIFSAFHLLSLIVLAWSLRRSLGDFPFLLLPFKMPGRGVGACCVAVYCSRMTFRVSEWHVPAPSKPSDSHREVSLGVSQDWFYSIQPPKPSFLFKPYVQHRSGVAGRKEGHLAAYCQEQSFRLASGMSQLFHKSLTVAGMFHLDDPRLILSLAYFVQ